MKIRLFLLPVACVSLIATEALGDTAPPPPPAAAPLPSAAPTTAGTGAASASAPAAPPGAAPVQTGASAAPATPPTASVSVAGHGTSAAHAEARGNSSSAILSETPSDELERRVIVFTDGGAPRLVSSGDRAVRGPLELEVRFRNVNPLCYEYSTSIAASRVAASDQGLPDRVPGIGALGATTLATFGTLEEAISAVNNAESEIDETLNAARMQVSLDDVWAACEGGGDFVQERARVEAAAKIAAARLGPDGTWRQTLESAEAVALGARRLARELVAGEQQATQDVDAKKAALAEAERTEQGVREQAAHAGRTRKIQEDLDDAARELASAQRKLREAELGVGRHRRAGDLGRAAERLGERARHALEVLSGSVADINRARALLARSPTAIRRRFGAGETVAVVVERTRLDRGERVPGRAAERFEGPGYRTLHPIILDVGIGPALGIGHNTAKYETRFSPGSKTDIYPAWRVVRTEQGLPLDAMLSISAYIWQRRYFDDVVVDDIQFAPRPMIGVSLAHPLSEFYAGLQIDPIAFLDISGGVRFANEETLIGPQPEDRALVSAEGPEPPLTRKEIRASAFVSLTVSTNLLYSWIKQGL